MRLSILDQSPVISGQGAAHAISETVALARRAEALGFHRYWLAEHHAIAALADPCPEILLTRLGAETSRMRVGTAESFRMLEALYPGRIDLGVGRAPGGDARTAQAVGHLDGTLPAPEVWLLGSSDYSGALAAQLGLPFSFAHFINPRGGDAVTRFYRENFQTGREASARTMVCTFAICGESDADAERLAASIDLRRLHMALNIDSPVPTLEEAARHSYTKEERQYVLGQRARYARLIGAF